MDSVCPNLTAQMTRAIWVFAGPKGSTFSSGKSHVLVCPWKYFELTPCFPYFNCDYYLIEVLKYLNNFQHFYFLFKYYSFVCHNKSQDTTKVGEKHKNSFMGAVMVQTSLQRSLHGLLTLFFSFLGHLFTVEP